MNSVAINKIINIFFKNLTVKQIIIRNSFWLVFSKLISGILRALLVILSARILGANEYGSFSLAMNFVLIFSFLPELGLTSILTREISKEKNLQERYNIFNNILLLSLVLSLISYFLIIILGSLFIKNELSRMLLPILSLMLIFDIFREFSYAIYRAELKSELQGIFHFLTNLLLFIGGIFTLYFFKGAINLSIAYLVTIILGFFISNIFLIHYFKNFKINLDYKKWIYYFNSSWPIAIANALYLLLLFIDSIILGWYFPSNIVGIYNSSVKINEFLIIFPTGIALALLPMFSKNISNPESLKNILELGIKLIYIIVLPIIFGGFIIAEKLVDLIFGHEYINSHYALKILIPSLLATSIFMVLSQLLIALNKRRELLIYEFLIFFVNLIGNLFLIPKFSFVGAAYITTLSNFMGLVLGSLVTNKYLNFNIWYGIKKPLVASFLMSLLIIILLNKINLLFIIFISIIFYFLILIYMKEEFIIKIFKNLFLNFPQNK
ncbi:MAG: polysaccharide biosynthesis protein [Candidatus Parcubacteria bacterium]|nr:MAG: polysaccharide biosynthesis protein [Candidatus Parcubacteria bacterium]